MFIIRGLAKRKTELGYIYCTYFLSPKYEKIEKNNWSMRVEDIYNFPDASAIKNHLASLWKRFASWFRWKGEWRCKWVVKLKWFDNLDRANDFLKSLTANPNELLGLFIGPDGNYADIPCECFNFEVHEIKTISELVNLVGWRNALTNRYLFQVTWR